jgi:hypothetical protein
LPKGEILPLERVDDNWVARWYIFKPKIPFWVNFSGACNGNVGLLYGSLVYFGPFDTFYAHLVYFWCLGIYSCTKKNLVTLDNKIKPEGNLENFLAQTSMVFVPAHVSMEFRLQTSMVFIPAVASMEFRLLWNSYLRPLLWDSDFYGIRTCCCSME